MPHNTSPVDTGLAEDEYTSGNVDCAALHPGTVDCAALHPGTVDCPAVHLPRSAVEYRAWLPNQIGYAYEHYVM